MKIVHESAACDVCRSEVGVGQVLFRVPEDPRWRAVDLCALHREPVVALLPASRVQRAAEAPAANRALNLVSPHDGSTLRG